MGFRLVFNWRSALALLLILATLGVVGVRARADLFSTIYILCLGRVGDGPRVTRLEQGMCQCWAERAVITVPVKSLVPAWALVLSEEDWSAMRSVRRQCLKRPVGRMV